MGVRKGIKKDDETALLTKCRRRCCLCYWLNDDKEVKRGQIAHIDQNSSNSKLKNLAWLCLRHHDEYDSQTSQSKGITKGEVIRYKEKLEDIYTENDLLALSNEPLILVDSFPKNDQSISLPDLNKIFLKFNKPVDRESATVIRNHYMRRNLDVQWTVGGWIQYKEDDTKLIWHPHPEEIERIKLEIEKTQADEHVFEVLIGTNKGNQVKAKDGSVIEPTYMEIFVDLEVTSRSTEVSQEHLSRAEMLVAAIIEVDGLAGYEPPTVSTFDDVQIGHKYYDFVESAVQLGIISGYTNENGQLTGLFGPNDVASRAWATEVLVNSFVIPITLSPPSPFTDVAKNHLNHDHVLTAYNQSVINGKSDNIFAPDEPITRGLMEEWLDRAKNPIKRFN